MYTEHFGLSDLPFSIAPDPRYLYMSDQHREALAHLVYGVTTDGGFVLLTGEVGTGKTTVCRCLLEQVPAGTDIAFILNPRVTVEELLASVCDELGVDYPPGTTSNKVFIDRINAYLLDAHARGRKTVLVIEEAQNLSAGVLEQIRLLTNLETNERKLLQIIVLGQPELREMLARPELRQLSQRITARYHLGPLSPAEVAAYVSHRLAVAGFRGRVMTAGAMRLLCRLSGGVPRLVNLICDRALLGAYVQNRQEVDRATLRRAAQEVLGVPPRFSSMPVRQTVLVVILLAAIGTALAVMYTGGAFSLPRAAVPVQTNEPLSAPKPDTLLPPAGMSSRESKQVAFRALVGRLGLPVEIGASDEICPEIGRAGIRCLDLTGNVDLLRRMNRPAVLRLQDEKGNEYYAALTSLQAETAVLRLGGQRRQVSVEELSRNWLGEFTILWRTPGPYRGEIRPGERGPMVRWLAERLALREGGTAGRRDGVYDAELLRLVKRFQMAEGLKPDGVVGPQTIIRLDTPSPQDGPALSSPEGGA